MSIVVWYTRCVGDEPREHRVVAPSPELLEQLKQRGCEPSSDGLIAVSDVDCPACVEDHRNDLRASLYTPGVCDDVEAIEDFVKEFKALEE